MCDVKTPATLEQIQRWSGEQSPFILVVREDDRLHVDHGSHVVVCDEGTFSLTAYQAMTLEEEGIPIESATSLRIEEIMRQARFLAHGVFDRIVTLDGVDRVAFDGILAFDSVEIEPSLDPVPTLEGIERLAYDTVLEMADSMRALHAYPRCLAARWGQLFLNGYRRKLEDILPLLPQREPRRGLWLVP